MDVTRVPHRKVHQESRIQTTQDSIEVLRFACPQGERK